MTKEKILKLLESSNEGDNIIGLSFLVGKSLDEIIKYFKLEKEYATIAKSSTDSYKCYKISDDCVIYYLINIFPASLENKKWTFIDLTKKDE